MRTRLGSLVLIVLVLGAAGVNYVYLSKQAVPIRWLVPGPTLR